MPSHEGSILVVDDESAIRENLELLLSDANYKVTLAENGTEGLKKLESEFFDLVLLDVMMPDKNGLEVLREIHLSSPETAIIMITAFGTIENAVTAIKAGAADYVTKPWDNEKLLLDIRNGIQQRKLQLENRELKKALKQRYGFSNIVGKSEKMLKIFDLVTQVAQSRSTVLIQGESGTGKELIAKAIHANSNRSENAFVTVNSGSLPTDLLESTLFGHLKGAFTSAVSSKKGLFEVADHGSIFFDEIGTISLETQAKLLRCKKWIINFLQMLLGDANTGINHFDSEGRIGAGSPDHKLSAVRHGIFGINEEIEKDLLKFARISENLGNAGTEFSSDSDLGDLELVLQERKSVPNHAM